MGKGEVKQNQGAIRELKSHPPVFRLVNLNKTVLKYTSNIEKCDHIEKGGVTE